MQHCHCHLPSNHNIHCTVLHLHHRPSFQKNPPLSHPPHPRRLVSPSHKVPTIPVVPWPMTNIATGKNTVHETSSYTKSHRRQEAVMRGIGMIQSLCFCPNESGTSHHEPTHLSHHLTSPMQSQSLLARCGILSPSPNDQNDPRTFAITVPLDSVAGFVYMPFMCEGVANDLLLHEMRFIVVFLWCTHIIPHRPFCQLVVVLVLISPPAALDVDVARDNYDQAASSVVVALVLLRVVIPQECGSSKQTGTPAKHSGNQNFKFQILRFSRNIRHWWLVVASINLNWPGNKQPAPATQSIYIKG